MVFRDRDSKYFNPRLLDLKQKFSDFVFNLWIIHPSWTKIALHIFGDIKKTSF